jgi:hypothetical protein
MVAIPSMSWGLSEISDSELGQQLVQGWQKASYIDCINRYTELVNQALDTSKFDIEFGAVVGSGEDCSYRISQAKNSPYSLDSGKIKFGFSIIPNEIGPEYAIKTVLYLRPTGHRIEKVVKEELGSCKGPSLIFSELSEGDLAGRYRLELFVNNSLISQGSFEIR